MGLNNKQKRFCEEYVIDFNATQAAVRAGYSAKSAGSTGPKLLRHTGVSAYVRQLQQELCRRSAITADMVVYELARCGFSNIQDYMCGNNCMQDLSNIERHTAAAIASIKITEVNTSSSNKVTTEFKLHDKISALEKLGKHLGVFEKDPGEKAIKIKVTQL